MSAVDFEERLSNIGEHIQKTADKMIVENNVIKMPDNKYVPNPDGLGCQLFEHMKRHKDQVAQIDAHTGETETYSQLLQRCIRTAIALKARKVDSNDVICVSSYNQLDSCVPYVAGLFIGAKVCALDPSLSFEDSKHLIMQVKPKIIFVAHENKDTYDRLLLDAHMETELVVFGDCVANSFGKFAEESNDEHDFIPEKARSIFDTAVIIFSSGTTGLAKGICLNHFSLLAQATFMTLYKYNIRVCLLYASLYWISSVFLLFETIVHGHVRVQCRTFSPVDAWHVIAKYKVTFMLVTPIRVIDMLKVAKSVHLNTTSLKDIIIGGTPIYADNLLALRQLLLTTNVLMGYGLTEVAGSCLMFRNDPELYSTLQQHKLDSCGQPLPGFWYKVVDLETEEALPCNKIGELRIKSKFELNGYYNRDSSEAWDADGWLRTGDVCYYDEDYCFYIVDRIKEMLKFQSWHVAPAVLERILLGHPAVKAAVVLGVPHNEDGEHPFAVVVKEEGAEDVTAETLVDYVNIRVDDRKKLRAGVVFVDEIPYTPSGKVKRRLLKESVLEEVRMSNGY